jgi:hypothetical protein
MKSIVFAVLLLLPVFAVAATLEDSYLSERDGFIEKFAALDKAGKVDDAAIAQSNAALASLQKKLESIVAIDKIPGYAAKPKFNIDTLFKTDEGFGALDALTYPAVSGNGMMTVTSTALLQRWLIAHEHWWEGEDALPTQLDRALRTEAFYTQAISSDAAVVFYGEIPVTKTGAKLTVAHLDARTQDLGPKLPDEILAVVVGDKRVFIVAFPVAGAVAAIPKCDAILKQYEQKQAALDPGKKDQDADASIKRREEGARAYRACFAEALPSAAFFPALTRKLRAALDVLPLQ